MSKSIKVLRYFGKIEGGQDLNEEQFRALKHGDKILVQLDGAQPEVRKFTGFGRGSKMKLSTKRHGFVNVYYYCDPAGYHRCKLSGAPSRKDSTGCMRTSPPALVSIKET